MKKKDEPFRTANLSFCRLKILKIMKLTSILLILTVLQVFAEETYSQATKLSFNLGEATVEQVLKEIENNSQFYFLFNQDLVDVTRKVQASFQDQPIDGILASLFENTNVDFYLMDRQIILSPKEYLAEVKTLQPRTVTGKVTEISGEPLIGVTVIVKGTNLGAITDVNGEYSIPNVPENATLQFSFVGMRIQEIVVGNQTTINVEMEESAIDMEEVVVVGYGTQKKVNLTGSVTNVSSDKLGYKTESNASIALIGELSGVYIRQLSGNPRDGDGTIRIRGTGTFSSAGSEPLVIIDGIQSSINTIDPNDIERVSVLKDAASSAIYGSQAANGVILIETKQGRAGAMRFNFYSHVGFMEATTLPEMVDSWIYAESWNEAAENMGAFPIYTEEDIEKYRSGTDPDYPNDKHMEKVWNSGKGIVSKYGLSMSGGTEATQFMFSASYLDKKGIILNNDMQDYNMRLNMSSNLMDNLKLTTNISANQTNGRQPLIDRITRGALRLNNTIIGVRDDGYYGHIETTTIADLYGPSFYSDDRFYLFGTGELEWEIFNGFTLFGRLGYTDNFYESKDFLGDFVISPLLHTAPNDLVQTWSKKNVLTERLLMNYEKSLENHSLSLLAGFEQMAFSSRTLMAHRDNFPSNGLNEITAGSVTNSTNDGYASRNKLRSFFGRANYNYDNRYLVEANLRYDGSSRFPVESRWGLFPGFSAAWRVSQESFFSEALPWIYNLKIRASWGELGNQSVGNYPYQDLISLDVEAAIGDAILPAAAVTTIPSKDITWETTRVADVGLDLMVWDGKIALSADYYNRLTYDILYGLSRSYMLGVDASPVNAGEVENRGWDLSLTHKNTFGNFSYSVTGNLAINHNKVLYIESVEQDIKEGLFTGYPIGSAYGYVADGLFVDQADVDSWPDQSRFGAEPGLIRFKDLSGPDGVPDGIVDAEYDRTVIGQPMPITIYALSISAEYKGFFLSAMFQGEGGRTASMLASSSETKDDISLSYWMEHDNQGNVQQFIWDTRWTTENPDRNAGWPKLQLGGDRLPNRTTSTFWQRETTFVRLKNLQVGYNVPDRIVSKIRMDGARIYVNGENLLTFTKFYPGWDPEIYSRDEGWYPLTKTWLVGISIDF